MNSKRGGIDWCFNINKEKQLRHKLAWPGGYSAFSEIESQTPTVIQYMCNQEKHHESLSVRPHLHITHKD